ncbi:aminotransferase class V-fold PLP-dependent enzyme [Sciscionella sediminilitoris]|uniref:aminotransferase class V-fold PLP-dependent enzyme n=1 Tax=Sciscionella sediminilitoris TaxID=1445613 RepID=UPI0004DED386|nr:aminotransferase class V-fold PLP-dependent enzyme [Sciscionella sp. SE31]
MTIAPVRPATYPAPVRAAVPGVRCAGVPAPLVDGRRVEYANLDHGASAPCLDAVADAVDEFLPYYASVHRGAGYFSQISTKVYEGARASLRAFTGARERDAVVFTRNTTDALNLLAESVPRGTSVVLFDTEHHAALLPWRGRVTHVPTPRDVHSALSEVDTALAESPEGPRLLVVCGASNVTGELWPVAELAAIARRHGARTVLDAAQLAPHRPVDIRALDVDYVVLSGHKCYAPYGAGALIGRADWLNAAQPYLAGGGATKLVNEQLGVSWAKVPERHEAGSPNVVGVHALAVAAKTLGRSAEAVAEHENALLDRLRAGLATIPGVRELSLFDGARERVGVVSFTLDGIESGLLAAVLSAEHGIGVRDGKFCAHIATGRLLAESGAEAETAVRVSIGLGTRAEHIERLLAALRAIVLYGPSWDYAIVDGKYAPSPDPRPLPAFLEE